MNFRSHEKKEIREALKKGQEVWALDTGTSGNDDHLIGTHQEVLAEILNYHEIEELPENWTLDKVDWEI